MTATDELFLDPIDPVFRQDPYPTYRRLLAELPVHRSPLGLVTYVRHEDCATLLTDPRFGKDVTRSWFWQGYQEAGLTPPLEPLGVGTDSPVFAFTDPPEHSRRRRTVTRALSGSWWDAQGDRVAGQLAAALAPRSAPFDLVGEVARPFVLAHLADLLDVPAGDRAEFGPLAESVGPLLELDVSMDEEIELGRNAAAYRLREYFEDRLRAAGGEPGAVGRLAAAVAAGELSVPDAAAVCVMIVIGAVEPLTGLVSSVVEHLSEEWRAALTRSPELLEGYVEEVLRLDPAVQQVPRVVLEPVTLHGLELEPGETVTAVLAAANRDPAVFADPDRIVPGRPARQHLGLGTGPHVCFGARITRAVGRQATAAAIRAGVRLDGDPAGMAVTEGVVLRRRAELTVRSGSAG